MEILIFRLVLSENWSALENGRCWDFPTPGSLHFRRKSGANWVWNSRFQSTFLEKHRVELGPAQFCQRKHRKSRHIADLAAVRRNRGKQRGRGITIFGGTEKGGSCVEILCELAPYQPAQHIDARETLINSETVVRALFCWKINCPWRRRQSSGNLILVCLGWWCDGINIQL